ncbi:zinc transport system substrate-binding protein [Lederbergia galactosidilyticus]|nr:zinc transport system substrate-binding protein [Lederbergia galactosidilytica]
MKKSSIFLTLFLLISIFLSGCQTASSSKTEVANNEEQPLAVFTTIFTIEDFTKKIGGNHVQVESVYPAGADAHTFEPTMKKMMEIADADLFIFNGAGLEPFIDKTKDIFTKENVTLVEASQGVELLQGDDHGHDHGGDEHEHSDEHDHGDENELSDEHDNGDESELSDEHDHGDESELSDEHDHGDESELSDEHDHGDESELSDEHDHGDENEQENSDGHDEHGHHHHDQDPHIWLDPYHAMSMAENIKNALIDAMPSAKEDFEENYQSLQEELKNLDEELKETIDSSEHPEILVSHASYGYWEHRYGLKQISISGLNPENEPSQKQLQTIVKTVAEHDITYIVYDQTPITKVADVVKKETGATPVTLHNLEYITEDDLNNHEDYFSIMEANIQTLQKILKP